MIASIAVIVQWLTIKLFNFVCLFPRNTKKMYLQWRARASTNKIDRQSVACSWVLTNLLSCHERQNDVIPNTLSLDSSFILIYPFFHFLPKKITFFRYKPSATELTALDAWNRSAEKCVWNWFDWSKIKSFLFSSRKCWIEIVKPKIAHANWRLSCPIELDRQWLSYQSWNS